MTINYSSRTIQLTKKFAKAAEKFGSDEYKNLQEARRDNPTFKIVVVSRKTSSKKDTYKGLTYEWMRNHIETREPEATREAKLHEFDEMIYISECHSRRLRYPTIKKWFLKEYPDVAKFGTVEVPSEAQDKDKSDETNSKNLIPMPEVQTANDAA